MPKHLQRRGPAADACSMCLAVLFPPTCIGCDRLIAVHARLPLCTSCSADVLPLPSARAVVGDVTALHTYAGVLARAVSRLKDGGELVLAGPLGRMLATSSKLAEPWDLVLPVPAHARRVLLRGVDHSAMLARWMVSALPARTRPILGVGLLSRTRLSPRQSTLPRDARLHNVAGAFTCPHPALVQRRRVLVVDDVTTTGATMQACLAALRLADCAHVEGLALLRTLDE